jgi:RNA polymerase sigma factor (TIGR02999 family)
MKATKPAKSDHPIFPGSARTSRAGFGALAETSLYSQMRQGRGTGGRVRSASSLSSVKLRAAPVSFVFMVAGSLSPQQISDLLATSGYWQNAQPDELAPLVYDELRQLAHRYMRGERPDHTLQTTALVNEAYMRLADQTDPHWQDRTHFFAAAARMMRHILVDYARGRQRAKRGAGAIKIELSDEAIVTETQAEQVVDLNDALERLAELDRRASQVVELKYFGGMNYEEIAEVLSVSAITVRRDWEFAKAWLHKELTKP